MSEKSISKLYDRIAEVKKDVAVMNNNMKWYGLIGSIIGAGIIKYLPL